MDKLLTISIAAYNAEKFINRCLEKIMHSSYLQLLDVIVINDGSIDSTSALAHKLCGKYPESFKVIDKENGGHGSTINTGIKEAKGKFFRILDVDDKFNIDELDKFLEHLMNIDSDLVLSNYVEAHENSNEKIKYECVSNDAIYGVEYELDNIIPYMKLSMHCFTYRTDLLKDNNINIDENCFYVDTEYVLFPLLYVRTVTALKEYVYLYSLGSEDQSVSTKSYIRNRQQHKKVLIRLSDFYNVNKGCLSGNIEKKTIDLISMMIGKQYWIYLQMTDRKNAWKECKEFDFELKKASTILYKTFFDVYDNKKIVLLVLVLRMTRFVCFVPVSIILNKLYRSRAF